MRGVYKKSHSEDLGEWTNYEILAKGLKKNFAVCLLSALSHYGLTDQILEDSWILVSNNSAIRHKGVRFFRSRNPMWNIQVVNVEGIPFTTLDRTLVECLVHQSAVSPNGAYGALVKALNQGLTKPGSLLETAKEMKYAQKIEKYLEPFIYAT
ncbi:MAG: hypothetical protein AB8C84_10730 [Oligoflexales bacterium]